MFSFLRFFDLLSFVGFRFLASFLCSFAFWGFLFCFLFPEGDTDEEIDTQVPVPSSSFCYC